MVVFMEIGPLLQMACRIVTMLAHTGEGSDQQQKQAAVHHLLKLLNSLASRPDSRTLLHAAADRLAQECSSSPLTGAAACSQRGALLILARCSGAVSHADTAEVVAGALSSLVRGLREAGAAAAAPHQAPTGGARQSQAPAAPPAAPEPPGLRDCLTLLLRSLRAHCAESPAAAAAIAGAMARLPSPRIRRFPFPTTPLVSSPIIAC